MRLFKTLWVALFMSVLMPLVPSRNTQTSGILSYRNNPADRSLDYQVAIPFRASYSTTLTYRYIVYNSNHQVIYTQPSKSTKVFRNMQVFITYRGSAGSFSTGRNSIMLYYKTTIEAERRHYSYFWGFNKGVKVILNNVTYAKQVLEAEFCYLYNSTNGTESFQKMAINPHNFSDSKFFVHDLYFDFSVLFISIGVFYDNPNFYSSALLYCDNLPLFPYLSNVGGKATQHLYLTRDYNRLVTSVKPPLYVLADTLQVSRYPHTGSYVSTTTLFFPRYHFDVVQNTGFRLEIKDFSYSQFNLIYDFSIQVDHPYLGTSGEHEVMINRY